MKLKEITNELERFAPLDYQESYDNSGLLVGDPETEITGALLCLDSTEDIIEEAINKKCNLIIAHHPIVFSGIKKLNGKNYVERTIIKAIKNDIAIYAAHTNMDNVSKGVNELIAKKLGLINLKVLAPKNKILRRLITFAPFDQAEEIREALFASGAGHIGDYEKCSFNSEGKGTFQGNEGSDPFIGEPGKFTETGEVKIETVYPFPIEKQVLEALIKAHPYEEVAYDIINLENKYDSIGSGMIGELEEEEEESAFLKRIKKIMKVKSLRHTSLKGKKIRKVAVCGGAGSVLLKDAIAAQSDVFITADFKYHQFFDADNKIVIADIGHYESEQFTPELFYEIINKKFPKFALHLSEINTNPVNYL